MMMIGVRRVLSSALSRRQASKPSMTGIMTSSRTRSGRALAANSMAWRPFSAETVS